MNENEPNKSNESANISIEIKVKYLDVDVLALVFFMTVFAFLSHLEGRESTSIFMILITLSIVLIKIISHARRVERIEINFLHKEMTLRRKFSKISNEIIDLTKYKTVTIEKSNGKFVTYRLELANAKERKNICVADPDSISANFFSFPKTEPPESLKRLVNILVEKFNYKLS